MELPWKQEDSVAPQTGNLSDPASTNKQTVSRSHLALRNKRAAGALAVVGGPGGAEAGG